MGHLPYTSIDTALGTEVQPQAAAGVNYIAPLDDTLIFSHTSYSFFSICDLEQALFISNIIFLKSSAKSTRARARVRGECTSQPANVLTLGQQAPPFDYIL